MFGIFTRFFLVGALLAPMALWASKRIVVDLTQQVAIAYQDGKVLFYGRISSGKPGRRTPTGHFRVLEKDIDHVSNLWPAPNGGARMHYMLRLTRDGVAMHLGPTPDYPASHGCVRMQNGFAQRMFFWAEKGIPVDVKGVPPEHSPSLALPNYADPKSMALYEQATQTVLKAEHTQPKGGNNALTALSSNPKRHQIHRPKLPAALENVIYGKQMDTMPNIPSERTTRPLSPLDALSSNPKRHHVYTRKNVSRPRPKRRPYREAHPDPLRAVSSH